MTHNTDATSAGVALPTRVGDPDIRILRRVSALADFPLAERATGAVRRVAIVDTETTGTDVIHDEIIDIAVVVIEVPLIATLAWALRRRGTRGPLGTLVLGVGCGLAVIAGLSVAVISEPSCRPTEFSAFGLACERV